MPTAAWQGRIPIVNFVIVIAQTEDFRVFLSLCRALFLHQSNSTLLRGVTRDRASYPP